MKDSFEIDISRLAEVDQFPICHSLFEGDKAAGDDLWSEAERRALADDPPLLDTPEKLEVMRKQVVESGGWEEEEVRDWSPLHLNALFLQWCAHDIRDSPRLLEDISFTRGESGWWYELDYDPGSYQGPFPTREAAWDCAAGNPHPKCNRLVDIDWDMRDIWSDQGKIPGNIYQGDDGKTYFYLGT